MTAAAPGLKWQRRQVARAAVAVQVAYTYESQSDDHVGALAGWNGRSISDSGAGGTVSAAETSQRVCGLVGTTVGALANSSAATAMEGYFVGGLVGFSWGQIRRSCTTGEATGPGTEGGLVGINVSSGVTIEINGRTETAASTTAITIGTGRQMEQREAVLQIRTRQVVYSLPAAQINIEDVSAQLGEAVGLADITVRVTVAEPAGPVVAMAEDAAAQGAFQLVVRPVEFDIICTYAGQSVSVARFHDYVPRTVAVPDGVDPGQITTGVVLSDDGSLTHVPTKIVMENGRYDALINRLTNSVYSVIWNPLTFTDSAGHGAQEPANDLGSRLALAGVGEGRFVPERPITRAEFAAMTVRALGLRRAADQPAGCTDVDPGSWAAAIAAASRYGLGEGLGDGTFRPEARVSREQAMVLTARALALTWLPVDWPAVEAAPLLSGFADGPAGRGQAWPSRCGRALPEAIVMADRPPRPHCPGPWRPRCFGVCCARPI